MSEEDFAKLALILKWEHIAVTMDYILSMDKLVATRNEFKSYGFDKKGQIRSMRLDQYQRWAHIKSLYASHRDEMVNTLDSEKFTECKSILESVFTAELDDALRDVIGDES
jgi:hypothetical protein